MPKMNPEVKAKWLEALRSGEYEQGQQNLRGASNQFCCLGVLCDIAVKNGVIEEPEFDPDFNAYSYEGGWTSGLGGDVEKWSGVKGLGNFTDESGKKNSLAFINDDGASFSEIADIIESEF